MIDWTKPIRTKSGLKAEFVRTLNSHSGILNIVVITRENGKEELYSYPDKGTFGYCRAFIDLENVPEERFVWINVYPYETYHQTFRTKEIANKEATDERIGRLKVKLEERWDE